MHWLSVAKWIGTITGVAGAMVIALNFGFIISLASTCTSYLQPYGAW
jgi:hypothetical protein